MKTKNLVYVGVIGLLAYLVLKNNKKGTALSQASNTGGVANSGGLNLGNNMDLPNLTPNNGLPTETALNNSNISPLLPEENEPTQLYGGVKLPPPYSGVSIVKQNPIDVVPVDVVPVYSNPINSTTPTPINYIVPNPDGIIIKDPVDVVPVYGNQSPVVTTRPRYGSVNPRSIYTGVDYSLADFSAVEPAQDTFVSPHYAQLSPNRY
jgi:hypothetical protein